MLEALAVGTTNAFEMAGLARKWRRCNHALFEVALDAGMREHQRFPLGIQLRTLGTKRCAAVMQTTCWVNHQQKQLLLKRNLTKPLIEPVGIDDADHGGERSGGKRGHGVPGKTPFVAAIETTLDGKPICLRFGHVASFCSASIASFAKHSLDPVCTVVSDGLQCFGSMTGAGCAHQAIKLRHSHISSHDRTG